MGRKTDRSGPPYCRACAPTAIPPLPGCPPAPVLQVALNGHLPVPDDFATAIFRSKTFPPERGDSDGFELIDQQGKWFSSLVSYMKDGSTAMQASRRRKSLTPPQVDPPNPLHYLGTQPARSGRGGGGGFSERRRHAGVCALRLVTPPPPFWLLECQPLSTGLRVMRGCQ